MAALDISIADDPEFIAAWQSMEARGFQWSESNIEKAHLGWLMARADAVALAEDNERLAAHLAFAIKLLEPWARGTAQIDAMKAALADHARSLPEEKP